MTPDLQTWLIPALVLLLLAALVWRIAVVRRRRIIRLPPRTGADAAPAAPLSAPPGPEAAAEAAPPLPPPPVAAAAGPPDDLRRIKGIGPKLETLLHELGVTRFEQIAGWSAEELAAIDARLGGFQGRPERDRWQEQARLLAAGDTRAFERLHGKIGHGA